jgi:hypothetical protein
VRLYHSGFSHQLGLGIRPGLRVPMRNTRLPGKDSRRLETKI